MKKILHYPLPRLLHSRKRKSTHILVQELEGISLITKRHNKRALGVVGIVFARTDDRIYDIVVHVLGTRSSRIAQIQHLQDL